MRLTNTMPDGSSSSLPLSPNSDVLSFGISMAMHGLRCERKSTQTTRASQRWTMLSWYAAKDAISPQEKRSYSKAARQVYNCIGCVKYMRKRRNAAPAYIHQWYNVFVAKNETQTKETLMATITIVSKNIALY